MEEEWKVEDKKTLMDIGSVAPNPKPEYDKYHWPCDGCNATLNYTNSYKDLVTGKHYCGRCYRQLKPNYRTNEQERTGPMGSLSKDD